MADYDWPEDIVPYGMAFYLQPHTGGSESPFSRKSKVYGLSAPRWIARMSVRGGESKVWGTAGVALWGQRLDAFLAQVKGRENRIRLYDYRRTAMSGQDWVHSASNLAAAEGATTMTITGLSPYARAVRPGDYIGGDGRPHIIVYDSETIADASGNIVVTFEPPLSAAVGAGDAVFGNPTGLFRLTSDDAGMNGSEMGELTQFDLEFVEDF